MLNRLCLRLLVGLILSLVASVHSHAGQAQTYILDPVHTQVVFFADHLGFSHGVGRLKVKQGWFQFDPNDWSSANVDVVIDMTSLDMGEAVWTQKVLSPQFLDSERWPTARFIGTALEKTAQNKGILHGDLWLRGVKQAIDLDVTFNRIGGDPYAFKKKAGFSARASLNRFDFGMQTFREVVGAPVELRIEVEGILVHRDTREIKSDAAEKQ